MNPVLYIRPARQSDVAAMLEIYRPYVENTTITFEYEPPSLPDFTRRFEAVAEFFPWLVCEYDGEVAGYAYASRHQERKAYQWDAELSIYIHPDYQRHRVGAALYRSLMRVLTLQGFLYAHALVTLPNEKSLAHHKRLGFETICVAEKTGYKHEKWLDVAELRASLAELPEKPSPPEPFRALDPHTVVQIFREEASQIAFP